MSAYVGCRFGDVVSSEDMKLASGSRLGVQASPKS